jgi:hypothetical protein
MFELIRHKLAGKCVSTELHSCKGLTFRHVQVWVRQACDANNKLKDRYFYTEALTTYATRTALHGWQTTGKNDGVVWRQAVTSDECYVIRPTYRLPGWPRTHHSCSRTEGRQPPAKAGTNLSTPEGLKAWVTRAHVSENLAQGRYARLRIESSASELRV